ncbi:MAG: InlB B-repeat-containing protein, partial [Clostridia bacterium]|nr:InlB B-repeat-containing protein [Clostridia bacterium]
QTDAEGIFWLVQCEWGTHTINVTSGDKKKTVTFVVDDFSEELENITLSATGSSAVVAPATGVTSIDTAALEAQLSDEDIAYAQTPGNTVNIETSVQEALPTSSINDKATQSYSTYTQGKTIDITINKVKTGAEAGTTAVSDVSVPVAYEVEMPASLQGMGKFIVLREHNGQVDALTTTPNADGEYIQVNNDTIKIVAAKFSTYTILGAPADPTPSYSGGGSSVTTYTVKFETNGASAIASVKVKKNGVVTMPESPVKDGFTFAGWYTDKACTKEYNFEEKVTKGFTLYAKWVEKVKKTLVLAIDKTDIEVDGTVKTNDVAPIIVNERAMLPIRFIAEELGAKVNWNGETQTVTVDFDDISIVIVIGESEATVNGEKVTLDSAPFIYKDRTFLPIRFVMEKLGADVLWNEEARTVTITK